MWHTTEGERVLTGVEAELFIAGLDVVLDAIWANSGDWDTGVEAFDDLCYGQKVFALYTAGRGLLRADVPAVEPTLSLEAAISAVFEELGKGVEAEIDDPDAGTIYRKLIAKAARELIDFSEPEAEPDCEKEEPWLAAAPEPDCEDEQTWHTLIDLLQERIQDVESDVDVDLVADLPPEQAQRIRQILGLSDEYVFTIPDDLNERQIDAAIEDLRSLVRPAA